MRGHGVSLACGGRRWWDGRDGQASGEGHQDKGGAACLGRHTAGHGQQADARLARVAHVGLGSSAPNRGRIAPQYPENMPQRVGSMGHAILNDRVLARYYNRDTGPIAAASIERTKRGWGEWTPELEDEFALAEGASNTLAEAIDLDNLKPIIHNGSPLAEVRLKIGRAHV